MLQTQIAVADITLSLSFNCDGCPGGTLVRLPDGVEASFSSPDCLLHLLEGMVGRRTWQAHHDQIEAQLAGIIKIA